LYAVFVIAMCVTYTAHLVILNFIKTTTSYSSMNTDSQAPHYSFSSIFLSSCHPVYRIIGTNILSNTLYKQS
jgi:hypothetical protein